MSYCVLGYRKTSIPGSLLYLWQSNFFYQIHGFIIPKATPIILHKPQPFIPVMYHSFSFLAQYPRIFFSNNNKINKSNFFWMTYHTLPLEYLLSNIIIHHSFNMVKTQNKTLINPSSSQTTLTHIFNILSILLILNKPQSLPIHTALLLDLPS